jgi:LmbE family N-acetylglucosaminyl deacetylase
MNLSKRIPPLKLLGVYAHPDDETFCAGGTLAKYVAGGAEAMVFSATRGEAGQIRDPHAATRQTLGEMRCLELQRACQELGVQGVICRDHGDGKLKDIEQHLLVEEVVKLIRTFRPDVVLTFGDDGAYGHPDHIAIGAATDEAFFLSGDPKQFPQQIADGLSPYAPTRLYHSYFPRNRQLLLNHLVRWLKSLDRRFHGTLDFINGLLFFADESTSLGYSSDHVDVGWYPPGFSIIEQGEPPSSLYLLLSGSVEVFQDNPDGSRCKVNELGPGIFFGEEGLASGKPRNAHVVARDCVTCLVFSPGAPTAFAGRGEGAKVATEETSVFSSPIPATTCIDVTEFIPQKIAAVASYRTQYPISTDMFSLDLLKDLMGREYFVRIHPKPGMETEL